MTLIPSAGYAIAIIVQQSQRSPRKRNEMTLQLTTDQVWQDIEQELFAVAVNAVYRFCVKREINDE
jgi:hypothetical protein